MRLFHTGRGVVTSDLKLDLFHDSHDSDGTNRTITISVRMNLFFILALLVENIF